MRCLVFEWNRFRPTRKAIDKGQTIPVVLALIHGNDDVHVYVLKPAVGIGEVRGIRLYVSWDFRLLAVETIFAPFFDFAMHLRPHIPLSNKLICDFRTAVGRLVE